MDTTKEKILAAAERLFASRGLEGVTTREICREAGVNGALVNYHFGTKEKLYGACLRRMFETGGGEALASIDRTVVNARSWKIAVRVWVQSMSETMHDAKGRTAFTVGVFRHEIFRPSSMSAHIIEHYGRPVFDSLCRLLRMATQSEEEVHLWATSIWAQLSACALVDPVWQEPFRPAGVSREKWAVAFTEFVCGRIFRELKFKSIPAKA